MLIQKWPQARQELGCYITILFYITIGFPYTLLEVVCHVLLAAVWVLDYATETAVTRGLTCDICTVTDNVKLGFIAHRLYLYLICTRLAVI